jgi:hypothetical protein
MLHMDISIGYILILGRKFDTFYFIIRISVTLFILHTAITFHLSKTVILENTIAN